MEKFLRRLVGQDVCVWFQGDEWHGTLEDFNLELRLLWLNMPISASPSPRPTVVNLDRVQMIYPREW